MKWEKWQSDTISSRDPVGKSNKIVSLLFWPKFGVNWLDEINVMSVSYVRIWNALDGYFNGIHRGDHKRCVYSIYVYINLRFTSMYINE